MTPFRSWALAWACAAVLAAPAVRAQEKCNDCPRPSQGLEDTRTPVFQCWLSFGTMELPKPEPSGCRAERGQCVSGCGEEECSCSCATACRAALPCTIKTVLGGPYIFALRPQIAPFLPPCTLMVQITPPTTRSQQAARLSTEYRCAVDHGEQAEAMEAAKKALELDPNCAWANAALKAAATPVDSACGEEPCYPAVCPPKASYTPPAREAQCSSRANDSESDIERRLCAPISLSFKDTPLRQCIDDLSLMTGLQITIDLPMLREEGVDVQAPVTIELENTPLKSALSSLLQQLKLAFVIKDGAMQVTTEKGARGKMVARTYAIGDLLIVPLNAFAGCATCANRKTDTAHSVMQLITATICPETWVDRGGWGSVDYFSKGRALVVNQTPDIQEQVAELLAALRRVQEDLKSEAKQEVGGEKYLQHPPQYFAETPAFSMTKEIATQEAAVPSATPCNSAPECSTMPCPACAQGCAGRCSTAGCCAGCCPKKSKPGHARNGFVPMMMVPLPPMAPFAGLFPPCPGLPVLPCPSNMPMMATPPGLPVPPADAVFAVPPPPAGGYEMRPPLCVAVAPPASASPGWVVRGGKEALRIHGASLSGCCGHVTLTASGGACFEGHVHLKHEGDGQHFEVSAERGCVCWKDGRVELCAGNPGWVCVPAGSMGPGYMGPSPGSWDLERAEKGIHITSGSLEGMCEHVVVSEHGESMILEGHVHLKCHEAGQHAQLSADRVRVSLADGALQLNAAGLQAVAMPCAVTGCGFQCAPPAVAPPSMAVPPPPNFTRFDN
jgi:hypothetical protein